MTVGLRAVPKGGSHSVVVWSLGALQVWVTVAGVLAWVLCTASAGKTSRLPGFAPATWRWERMQVVSSYIEGVSLVGPTQTPM